MAGCLRSSPLRVLKTCSGLSLQTRAEKRGEGRGKVGQGSKQDLKADELFTGIYHITTPTFTYKHLYWLLCLFQSRYGVPLGQGPPNRVSLPRAQKGSNRCLFNSRKGCHLQSTYWEPDTAQKSCAVKAAMVPFSDLSILKPAAQGLAKN